MPTPLPIDDLLPEVVALLRERPSLVIEAPPGAGKTTRVPRAICEAELNPGEIVVLQPRRLPARLAAERVAEEMGERVGETIGYTIRFEELAGPRTRVRFVTEGILVRRLLADPRLREVGAVVLDEFHERHLHTDLAVALLRRLQQQSRPDLKLCVMSATLEAEPIREFLGDCPSLRSEGRTFPVDIEHAVQPDDRPVADQVLGAVRRLLQEGLGGDVLVFLPGAGEIRRATEALTPLAESKGLALVPLHGDLSPAEQARAVRPSSQRKVILSTNVAETSVTIPGVVAVIDTGLARVAAHSPWTGLPTLTVQKISQASAIQRAGRAGRTAPGRALRLYTRHDFDSRRGYELPEIARLDLAEALLTLHALGVRDPGSFAWFEPPPGAALEAATDLLRRLGAVDARGAITDVGRGVLRFPVHPRLGRLIVEGERRGVGAQAASLAAMVSEGDISDSARVRFGRGPAASSTEAEGGDLLERLDRFERARASRFSRDQLRALGVDGRAAEAVERTRRQLSGNVREAAARPTSPERVDEALGLATLAAFPDRLMRRRGSGPSEGVLATGGTADVPALPPDELLVAVAAEERAAAGGRKSGAVVRLAVGVQPEWIVELLGDALEERDQLVWNAQAQRVDRVVALAYGLITLDESRRPGDPSPEASRLLAQAARTAGWGSEDAGGIDRLRGKLEVLRTAFPDAEVPPLDEAALDRMLVEACEGRTSLAELRGHTLEELWSARLPTKVTQLLRAELPDRVRLPGGREVRVEYEPGKPPWIASRLQDFFGMGTGPAVARGRVPLTLHLLAPNQRPVQVTSDLAGFWQRHYPAIRRELGRKYPRHPWPEDGATAKPPEPKPPRRA